jgi:hypothetical protein
VGGPPYNDFVEFEGHAGDEDDEAESNADFRQFDISPSERNGRKA